MPIVIKNDAISYEQLSQFKFDNVVISPGPGNPTISKDFGICSRILKNVNTPILGVCLGHQGIASTYCNTSCIQLAPEPFHGRVSEVFHDGDDLFKDIPSPFKVARYHSLIVQEPFAQSLKKTAWTDDHLTMAITHLDKPIYGVQFHPESILCEYGKKIIQNFLYLSYRYHENKS